MDTQYTTSTVSLNVKHCNATNIVSDSITKTNGEIYITKQEADALYAKPIDTTSVYNWQPAQEQKIQFSLLEPYTVPSNGWFVKNADNHTENNTWHISINDRPMFNSDDNGEIFASILVQRGDTITSSSQVERDAYFMPCLSELRDWRIEELKSGADIWKNAVVTDADGNINVRDQWLDNTWFHTWHQVHASTYRTLVSYVNGDEAFDVNGNHLFYIQSENIRTGYRMFYEAALLSFIGDLSSLTDGNTMFRQSAIQSFRGDLSSLTSGSYMFQTTPLQSFRGDLSALTSGSSMFEGCKLDLASVQNIANTINDLTVAGTTGTITIGIQSSLEGNTDLTTALTTIEDKGWTLTTEYN